MLRTPTLRDLLRCVQRHLLPARIPCYISGAISVGDIPPPPPAPAASSSSTAAAAVDEDDEDDDEDDEDDDDGQGQGGHGDGGGDGGIIVLQDDDDIEAWWHISFSRPLEVQVVLDSVADAAAAAEMVAAGEMAQILGVVAETAPPPPTPSVGLKRPRIDAGLWEEVLEEAGQRRRRVG